MLSNITKHMKNLGRYRNILFQSYSPIRKSYSKRYKYCLERINHIQNPGISRRIWIYYADSGIFTNPTVRLIHIYWGIFRTNALFRHIKNRGHIYLVSGALLRHYLRVIYAFSEPYLGRFRIIQDPGVTSSNNVKPACYLIQVPLLNHCSYLFRTFLLQKYTFNIFFIQDCTSIITITIIKACHIL